MRTPFAALVALVLVAGCAVGAGAVVRGAGPDDLLKLRQGPGLEHPVIIGLPDGTRLTRQTCVPTNGRLWCRVFLADRPSVSGWVSAEYLAHR